MGKYPEFLSLVSPTQISETRLTLLNNSGQVMGKGWNVRLRLSGLWGGVEWGTQEREIYEMGAIKEAFLEEGA